VLLAKTPSATLAFVMHLDAVSPSGSPARAGGVPAFQDFGAATCFAVIHRALNLAAISPTARHERSESYLCLIFRDALTSLTVLWKMSRLAPGLFKLSGCSGYLLCAVQRDRCRTSARDRNVGLTVQAAMRFEIDLLCHPRNVDLLLKSKDVELSAKGPIRVYSMN